MKDNEYECSMCHGVFEKGWTDEEAAEEAEKALGVKPDIKKTPEEQGMSLVCDDCYNTLMGIENTTEDE